MTITDFDKWWHETGSGTALMPFHDHEEHAERVARAAWEFVKKQVCRQRDEYATMRAEALRERDEARRARDLALEERDKARLEIWENHPRNMLGAREFAAVRGWECFDKENHNA